MNTIQFKKTLTNIAVASVLLSSASTAYAKSDTTAETNVNVQAGNMDSANVESEIIERQKIETLVVTANRSQQEQYLALSSTQVIGKAEIEAIQPQNITELLSTVAGITVTNLGAAGQDSTVFTRGTNGNHTLVLVDGVRVGSATLGKTSFSSMSVSLIDRIEIVKGPRGALWGSDAIGGVIQIFTKKLQSGEGSVSLGFGSNGYGKTEAAIGLGNESHSLTLAGAIEKSDGFNATDYSGQEDEDGYDRQSFSLNGQSKITNEFSLDLVSHYEKGGADYDTKWGGADENEYENYSVKFGGDYNADSLHIETFVATSQDEGGTFDSTAPSKDVNEITTERDQFGLLAQYELSQVTSFVAGFDWYNEQVSNTSAVYQSDKRRASGLFLQARHQISAFLLEGAVRQDNIEGLDEEVTYNLSVGYQLSEDWLLGLSQGTGFKAPTFNDLYWPSSGNPNLKPEEVESTELLIRNQFSLGSLEVSIYDTDIDNLINWAPNAAGEWQPENIDNATAQGVDITLALQTGDFSHLVAAGYVDTEDKSTGNELLRRPKITATYTLGYQMDALTTNVIIDYRGQSDDNKFATVTLDSVVLTDISISYDILENLTLSGKINNIFDREYTVAQDYQTDGINSQAFITYNF